MKHFSKAKKSLLRNLTVALVVTEDSVVSNQNVYEYYPLITWFLILLLLLKERKVSNCLRVARQGLDLLCMIQFFFRAAGHKAIQTCRKNH